MSRQSGFLTANFEHQKQRFAALARQHFQLLTMYPPGAPGVEEYTMLQNLRRDYQRLQLDGDDGSDVYRKAVDAKIEELTTALQSDVLEKDVYLSRLGGKVDAIKRRQGELQNLLELLEGQQDVQGVPKRIAEIKAEVKGLDKTAATVSAKLKTSLGDRMNKRIAELSQSYIAQGRVKEIEDKLRNHKVLTMLKGPTPRSFRGMNLLPSEAHKIWSDSLVDNVIGNNRRLAEAVTDDTYDDPALAWLERFG